MLNSCLGKTAKGSKVYVGFPHITSIIHNTFLGFPKSVRMRSVDGCLAESISVVVITF